MYQGNYGGHILSSYLAAVCERTQRLQAKHFLQPGDVIGISRGAYEHYAIYAGNGRVIHYAGETADFLGKISIHEAPVEEFLKGDKGVFAVSFAGTIPMKIYLDSNHLFGGCFAYGVRKVNSSFSATETLKRAYSRIGETRYSIVSNNCEHFAMWCKTGRAESTQVKAIKSLLTDNIL